MSMTNTFADAYIEYMKGFKNCSSYTIKRYRSLFKSLEVSDEWCLNLTLDDARDIVCDLMDKGLKPSSINGYISMLKRFFRFLLMRNDIISNPFDLVQRLKQDRHIPQFLSAFEVRKIYDFKWHDTLKDREDKFCMHLMLDYALTISECINLKVEDINLSDKTLSVKSSSQISARNIPIFEDDFEYLYRCSIMRDKQESILPSRLLSIHNIRYMVNTRVNEIVGKIGINPTCLRNSLAMLLAANGCDLNLIRSFFGYKSISSSKLNVRLGIVTLKKSYQQSFSRGIETTLALNENKPQYWAADNRNKIHFNI